MTEQVHTDQGPEPRYRPNSVYEQLEIYIVVLFRRKWFLTLPVLIFGIIAWFVSNLMQPYYSSSTLILVEPQQVPDSYVKATDTTPIQSRLNTLRQQIMSRTKLEQVIKEFDPYREKKVADYNDLDRLLKWGGELYHTALRKAGVEVEGLEKKGPSMEGLVKRMRKDISVKVLGGGRKGGAAFSINFIGMYPYTTMQITNAVASLYIEENLRIREQYAEGTADFLNRELEKTEKLLKEKEVAVQEFKGKYMGALPEQLDSNLRTLDRLQVDLQTGGEAIRSVEESILRLKENLTRAIKEARKEARQEARNEAEGLVPETSALEEELKRLTGQLSQLRTVYKDTYPDVFHVKTRIGEVEALLNKKRSQVETPKGEGEKVKKSASIDPDNATIFELKSRVRSERIRLKELKKREKKIKKQLEEYERRVEQTSANEQWLVEILRDYEISRKNYESILEKKLSAKLAENMEKRQKGERFRVIDPANLPEKPISPNKLKVLLVGVGLGAVLGALSIYLLDFLNPAFRRPEDLSEYFREPVLASVPIFTKNTIKKIKGRTSRGDNFLTVYDPMVIEQYYILFTRIEQISQKLGIKVFAVTSSLKGEGKSTTAINLSYVISQEFQKRVALVDCDFKKPVVGSFFPELAKKKGLMSVLNREVDIGEALTEIDGTNISVLPIEHQVKNSVTQLGSELIPGVFNYLRGEFDYVIVDAPPILSLADMNIISKRVDSTIVVVRAGKTPKDIVMKGVDSLNGSLSGYVMNGVDVMLRKDYYNYY